VNVNSSGLCDSENSIDQLIDRSIWLCGCGRSGTSILSSLLASHQDVEYSFDPPIVHWLLSLSKQMEVVALEKVLKVYLYREVFRGALGGRYLNFNHTDLSSAYKFKSNEELCFRKDNSLMSWLDKDKESLFRLCIKVTDATFYLSTLREILPGISFIGTVRNPEDTIRSVYLKKWFARERVSSIVEYETLPFKVSPDSGPIPYWLHEEDVDLWLGANDWERAAIYCLRANTSLLDNSSWVSIINYDWFVRNAQELSIDLQSRFKLIGTSFTNEILDSISPRHSNSNEKHEMNIRSSLLTEVNTLKQRIACLTAEIK
jgi:hypothetical protein